MPTWQLTIAIALMLFFTGTVTIIGSRRKRTLLEGYAAWILAVVVMATGWYRDPKAFAPLAGFLARLGNSIGSPPIAVAAICWVILFARAAVALLDKNARLFAAFQPLGDIRLGPSPTVDLPRRSRVRRLIDSFRMRKPPEPGDDAATVTAAEPQHAADGGAAWRSMLNSERIRKAFGITAEEREVLAQVSFMREVSSPHDLRLVLSVLRSAHANLASEIESGAQEPPAEAAAEAPATNKPPRW